MMEKDGVVSFHQQERSSPDRIQDDCQIGLLSRVKEIGGIVPKHHGEDKSPHDGPSLDEVAVVVTGHELLEVEPEPPGHEEEDDEMPDREPDCEFLLDVEGIFREAFREVADDSDPD